MLMMPEHGLLRTMVSQSWRSEKWHETMVKKLVEQMDAADVAEEEE